LGENDYEGEKPEDDKLKNKTRVAVQDDESKEEKAEKTQSDQKKAEKKTIRLEIAGGQEALPNEFPWMVKLKMQCSPQGFIS
jgi:hypothetical protein